MTLHEAYLKAKGTANARGLTQLRSGKDFGAFWGFVFMPSAYDPDNPETRIGGNGYVTVNKESGGIGNFTPLMNFDLFTKGKPIPIDQFVERAAVA